MVSLTCPSGVLSRSGRGISHGLLLSSGSASSPRKRGEGFWASPSVRGEGLSFVDEEGDDAGFAWGFRGVLQAFGGAQRAGAVFRGLYCNRVGEEAPQFFFDDLELFG